MVLDIVWIKMKEKLSRLNVFKKFSLVQQLILVLSVIALLMVLVLMPLVDYNLTSIIDNEMYETLANEQDIVMNNSVSIHDLNKRKSKLTYHLIYDISSKTFTSSNLVSQYSAVTFYYSLFGDDLEKLDSKPKQVSLHNKRNLNNETWYYLITRLTQDEYLISIQNSDYSNELISKLHNQIIYIQYGFFILFAGMMILWVFSLIRPLKKIKNYIDAIKDRQDSELHIDREDEIGIVSQALVDMKENLDKQEKIKEEMIHNISHDLKTPIALIQTYGQSVKDDVYPYGDKDSSMDVIIENANRLEHKVKSFLYLNRLDYLQGEGNVEQSIHIKKLIMKIVEQMDVFKPEIQLNTDLKDVEFMGDEEHWRVAIENIIDNASRYASSMICITLKENYLEIYNDGEHIDEEELPYLFDPYVKGIKGQFGLGLSIVSKIVKMYGYQVHVYNRDVGVSFVFEKAAK